MKLAHGLLVLPLLLVLAACDQKPATPTEQLKDTVNDALDNRPHEKLQDAAEELNEGVENAAEELK